ncbi:hypothetical protein [Halocola ammonii]
MKNLFLTAVLAIAVAFSAQAQDGGIMKQQGGENNIELQLAPLGGSPISIGGIRYRKFTTATTAIRADVFVGFSNNSTITQQEDSDNDLEELRDVDTEVSISISPGIEMHLEGTNRLSPYYGGVLNIGYARMSTKSEVQVGDDVESSTTTDGTLTLGLNGVFGFDYYFAKNIYIGAELGFGLAFESELDTKTTYSDDSLGDDTETANGSSFNLGPNVVGQIRTGILF